MLTCVTNDMANIRSCRTKDVHLPNCEREECRGCMPRSADKGCLCWACWERLIDAATAWPKFAATISGLSRLVTPENTGGHSLNKNRIPLPQTWLDVEEAESYLVSLTKAGGILEAWVATTDGASDAINFMLKAESAFRAHPVEEKPHKATNVVCWECKKRTLVWMPPKFFGDEVHVTCVDPDCGYSMPQSAFELLAQIEETQQRSAK